MAALGDRVRAGDQAAIRLAAAQLRAGFPDEPQALVESGSGLYEAGEHAEAIDDLKRAVELDPGECRAWFLLGLAHNALGDLDSAARALNEACALEPENQWLVAALAAVQARRDSGWRAGLSRLTQMHHTDPANGQIAGLLAEVYFHHAYKGWTEVSAAQDGATVVNTATKLLRLAAEADVAPGLYPTQALHVKTAAACLERLKALPAADAELQENIRALEADVAAGGARKLHATLAEIAVSLLLFFGFFASLSQSIVLSVFSLLCGGALLMGSFEPQYRMNRIILSRRGQTLGDAAIGLAARHRYGGIAYSLFVMGCFPFIAAYKFHVNWVQGWLTKVPIADIGTDALPEPAQEDAARTAEQTSDPASIPVDDQAGSVAEDVAIGPPEPAPALSAPDADPPGSGAPVLPSLSVPPLPPRLWIAAGAGAMCVLVLIAWLVMRPGSGASDSVAAPVDLAAQAAPPPAPELVLPPPPPPVPISGAPEVVDTATLRINGASVPLQGIAGEGGIAARQMDSFIQEQGGSVTCEPLQGGLYRCETAQGYDVAAAALVNGAARASADASPEYQQLQTEAQTARRGVWQ